MNIPRSPYVIVRSVSVSHQGPKECSDSSCQERLTAFPSLTQRATVAHERSASYRVPANGYGDESLDLHLAGAIGKFFGLHTKAVQHRDEDIAEGQIFVLDFTLPWFGAT